MIPEASTDTSSHEGDENLPVSDALTDAIVALNVELDLPHVLSRFLDASIEHTGAMYAAINVLDDHGKSVDFYYSGMDRKIWDMIGRAPNAVGVLAEIPAEGALVIRELTEHDSFRGLPPNHPPLGSFLGSSLKVRGMVFGYLYLANKPGGFTLRDETVVRALAAAASVAIDNAQLYKGALQRERWLAASQEITTAVLADPSDETIFERIVDSARELAQATTVVLVLPGVGDEWVMEFTAGDKADELLGLTLPVDGYAMRTIRTGTGTISTLPPGGTVLEPVRGFGPSLYAPLIAEGQTIGLLMLWRDRGQQSFDTSDLAIAQRFANQAAVALSIAELNHVKNLSTLLDERERLADDLHDFVSQELFATAMQLEAISLDSPEEVRPRIARTLDHVRRAQHEVRGVMGALSGQRTSEPLQERLRREIIMAGDALGFKPRFRIEPADIDDVLAVDKTLSDDAIAVVRELLSNVSRHAQASNVQVDIRAEHGRFVITVVDDGIGPSGARNRHSGTSNLANRAIRRNGTFTLIPAQADLEKPGSIAEWNVDCT